jgi:hypothetical protein
MIHLIVMNRRGLACGARLRITFALPSRERWGAKPATNSWFLYAGLTTGKPIKLAMKSRGGDRTELIPSRQQTDCGTSAEVDRTIDSENGGSSAATSSLTIIQSLPYSCYSQAFCLGNGGTELSAPNSVVDVIV